MSGSLLLNTLWVAFGATLLALGLGAMVAMVLTSIEGLLRQVLLGLVVATLALPPFLLANTWMHYLGATGVWREWCPLDLYSPAGAILVLSLWLWPVSALAVWSAWQRLEPAQLEAEPELQGLALFRFLLVPLGRGAGMVAGLITLVLAANNLTVPALLQVNVYAAEVWLSFSSTFWVNADGGLDWRRAASLTWPLVLLPLLLMGMLRKRAFPWPTVRGGLPPAAFRRALGPGWLAGAMGIAVPLVMLSVGLPVWQIVGTSETWAQLPGVVSAGAGAIGNSLGTAALVAAGCVVIAVAVTQFGRRSAAFPRSGNAGSRFWDAAIWLPFLVPGVLIGILLIQLLNQPATGWFYQSMGVVLLALVLRYLAVGWALVRHALRSADPDLVDAARLEGASTWQIFWQVQWPQVAPQLAAAWYLVFLLCLWDVETLVLIMPPGGETVALRIFNLLHYGHTAHVNALCLVLLGGGVAPLLLLTAVRAFRRLQGLVKGVPMLAGVPLLAVMPWLVGCSPQLASNEARVESRIFDRVQVIATRGVAPGQVNKPRSVTVDPEDNLFVLDFTGRVQKFSATGEFLLFWQMPETERGNPKGLSVDRHGNIIVVEPHYSRVNLFTPEGRLLMQWGLKGTNAGEFSFPRAAVVNSRQEWFISEFGVVDRVQAFAFESNRPARLRFLRGCGRAGAGPGEFNRAEGLCVNGRDEVLVADAVNHRIQVLDAGGHFLWQFGRPGSAPGELSYPYDVCVDGVGWHYVCEFGNSRIQVFDARGGSLEILGGAGAAPGRFNNPWGVALDSHGNLYVADSQNHRVQKFLRKAEVRLEGGAVPRSRHPGPVTSGTLGRIPIRLCKSSHRNPPCP
jgi:ABC-type Fe3+ transport system permease subunit